MTSAVLRWPALMAVEPHALGVSARVFASLWAGGAAGSWLILALPQLAVGRTAILVAAVLTTVAAAVVWSLAGRRAERWAAPLSLAFGLPFAAAMIAATGGPVSAGRNSLVFVVVFAAWAFPLRAALVWEALTLVTYLLPLAYGTGSGRSRFAAEGLVTVSHWLALVVAVVVAKRMLVRAREQAERRAAEQAALRAIATAATEHTDPHAIYARVAEEAARLTGAPAAAVLGGDDHAWEVTAVWPAAGGGDVPAAVSPGVPPDAAARDILSATDVIAVPIRVQQRPWGIVAIDAGAGLDSDARRRLGEVAELLELVVAAVEGRRRLAEQAASDPLTGLANRRAFEARLEAEVARAERHDSGLVLVVLDLDHLKEVNDTGGHEAGDAHLCALAGALTGAARAEDLVARVGGDEFAWLLPEATAAEAQEAVQRMRVGLGPSISVGVAQFESGLDAHGLMRNADRALYAAKASGRAATSVFQAAE